MGQTDAHPTLWGLSQVEPCGGVIEGVALRERRGQHDKFCRVQMHRLGLERQLHIGRHQPQAHDAGPDALSQDCIVVA